MASDARHSVVSSVRRFFAAFGRPGVGASTNAVSLSPSAVPSSEESTSIPDQQSLDRLNIELTEEIRETKIPKEVPGTTSSVTARLSEPLLEPADYVSRAGSLQTEGRADEADALLTQAQHLFPTDWDVALAWAASSQRRAQWLEALRRWEIVRATFPNEPEGFKESAQALHAVGRAQEAEALVEDAMARFPADIGLAMGTAHAAMNRREWRIAVDRWNHVRTAFPDHHGGYVGGSVAHHQLGESSAADELLEEARSKFPQSVEAALGWALLAWYRQELPDAVRRFALIREAFPSVATVYLMSARILQEAGELDERRSIADTARERFPEDEEVAAAWVRSAIDDRNWAEVLDRCDILITQFPDKPFGYVERIRTLCEAGQLAEAQSALTDVRSRFRGVASIGKSLHEFEVRLIGLGQDPRTPRGEISAPHLSSAGSTTVTPDELLQYFESLGGEDHGCEFGFVQRNAGIEPLGLLRWTNISAENLRDMLLARLDGVGRPETTELIDQNGIYIANDKKFSLRSNTTVSSETIDYDTMSKIYYRRTRILVSKMKDDLERGGKIFVYRSRLRDLDVGLLDQIASAIQDCGPSAFLSVRRADALHPPPGL
jgi:tetratricopeptide (TPR) repeat protein